MPFNSERARTKRIGELMRNVVKTDFCWFWKGYVNDGSYGVTHIAGKSALAHRAAWMLLRGPIPTGMVVRHQCDNPRCVNPNHLLLGTIADNSRDAVERKRFPDRHGEANVTAKLKTEQIKAIRKDTKSTHEEIAKRYGVTANNIAAIRKGKTWRIGLDSNDLAAMSRLKFPHGPKKQSREGGMPGVRWERGRWVAKLRHNKKTIYVGRFRDVEEAKAAHSKRKNELLELFQ